MRSRPRPASRRRRLVAALLGFSLLLPGCAEIPTSGPIQAGKAENAGGVGGQQPVRVFAEPPQEGWTPSQVVSGFLAAMASQRHSNEVARQYLTPDIRSSWPSRDEPAIVYSTDEQFRLELGRDDTVTVSATKTATISSSGAYRAARNGATMEAVFRLQRVDGEWRIGSLPDNVLLKEFDAYAAYTPFDLFFFAKDSDVLVANAIVLSTAEKKTWPAQLVSALLSGPTEAVAAGVRSAIPEGTRLESQPTVDENGTVTVRLGGAASDVTGAARRRMVGQITATLMHVEGVSGVRVQTGEETAPTQDSSAFSEYEPAGSVATGSGYFVSDGELVSVDTGTAKVSKVAGPFGAGALEFTHPALSLDARRVAALSVGGNDLWVGPLDVNGKAVKLLDGARLSAPSWDRYGNLWVVENTANGPRLLMFPEGKGEPVEVDAPALDGLDVRSVRVSWDGVRVAFVAGGGDSGELFTGVLDRGGDDISLHALRPVAPTLSGINDVWWYDRRSLAVAGREQSDLVATYLVSVDGLSLKKASSVPDVADVAAASGMPLLVSDTEGQISLSQPDEFGSTGLGQGTSPAYPG